MTRWRPPASAGSSKPWNWRTATTVTSPAAEAGLRVGDTVRAIDGHAVADWNTLQQLMVTGSGRDATGRPEAIFTVERDGRQFDLTLHPRITKEDRVRQVGISNWFDVIVAPFSDSSLPAAKRALGERLGFHAGRPDPDLRRGPDHELSPNTRITSRFTGRRPWPHA